MPALDSAVVNGASGLLNIGTRLLRGQYEIEAYLASGGFAVTYLARDSLARLVVLKECFPGELCARRGDDVIPAPGVDGRVVRSLLARFIEEARRLAKLDHPNVVRVHQVFEENNTAYMAMDYVEGTELLDISDSAPERLTRELMLSMLEDTLTGIDYVHERGLLHRDIAPDNILLDAKDRLTLIDFGGARERTANQDGTTLMMAVKEGYSPHEFYVADGDEGPWSDLYSVAATFYRLITGIAPPDGLDRLRAVEAGQPDPYVPLTRGTWPHAYRVQNLIDRGMALRTDLRPASAREWLAEVELCKRPADRASATASQIRLIKGRSGPVLSGEALESAVSQIVSSSRQSLVGRAAEAPVQSAVQGRARTATPATDTARPAAPPRDARQPDCAARKLVDLFGNPVADPDAWLRDEDRKSRVKVSIREHLDAREQQAREHKSTILKFLSASLSLSGLSSPRTGT